MAVRVDIDESSLTDRDLGMALSLLDSLPNEGGSTINSFAFDAHVQRTRLRLPWRQEYQLLPQFGVMVDGFDITPKQFTWRPARSAPADVPPNPSFDAALAKLKLAAEHSAREAARHRALHAISYPVAT